MFEESTVRSLIKAISWRVLATLTTAALVFAFTRQLDIAVAIGLLETIIKILLYVGHERIWNQLKFGRKPKNSMLIPHEESSQSRKDQEVSDQDRMTA